MQHSSLKSQVFFTLPLSASQRPSVRR